MKLTLLWRYLLKKTLYFNEKIYFVKQKLKDFRLIPSFRAAIRNIWIEYRYVDSILF